MVAWLPSIPYPAARDDGYWHPITSTLDWCEENYYATQYSAEIVNSVTNLIFIYLAFRGAKSCIVHGHDRIFLVTFIGYFLVGSGSFAFHSTLKYPMQLVDELSMIYTTCLMFWATFSHNRKRWVQVSIGLGTAGLAVFITLYYHYLQDPTFHQNAYAVLTAVVLGRSMYIMERDIRPHFRGRKEEHERQLRDGTVSEATRARELELDDRDRWILKQMWTMIALGMTMFLGGFAIWSLDNAYCLTIRKWRHEIGLPWGVFLEGHGWWHLGTGTGAYFYIVWGIWLRHCLNGRADEYGLQWPSHFTSLPEVVRHGKPATANGFTKKRS